MSECERLTGGFGAGCKVGALNSDTQQGVRARAVLVHLGAKCDPVSSSCS